MKNSRPSSPHPAAVTLIEMSLVVCILLVLMGTGFVVSGRVGDWRLGRLAGETLRTVHAAQRLYLADNPTTTVASITEAALIPYLPDRAQAMPTIETLTGEMATIRITVMPPVAMLGDEPYDPSSSTTDSLWDVGE